MQIPKCDHLVQVGLENLENSHPQWQPMAGARQRQWYLAVADDRDHVIRDVPSHHAPFGLPYGFAQVKDALIFRNLCVEKLKRHLARRPVAVAA
jgi:hypothetical protein